MAGYSGTPLATKLGIKDGHRVVFPSAPDGFRELLGDLPEDVTVKPHVRGPLDVIVFFTKRRAELERWTTRSLRSTRRGRDCGL